MFEDQPTTPNVPKNLPLEPADMFAGIDEAASAAGQPEVPAVPTAVGAGLLKKKTAPAFPGSAMPEAGGTGPAAMPTYAVKEPVLGKIILLLVFVGLLGGLAYGGWWAYNNFFVAKPAGPSATFTPVPIMPVTPTQPVTTSTDSTANMPTATESTGTLPSVTSTITSEMGNDQILFGEQVDTDKDGLDDIREQELGTNPKNPDTDGDGLSDGDEVLIWKTDPLKKDTDGDGFDDGTEIKNGYNPLGPGKLFNVTPAATGTTTTAK